MTAPPEVSVVMGVYNGGDSLERTIASVLSQEGVDLEFIVVNDGSTDGSRELLDRLAHGEPRLRLIHQENVGLTVSLARGCGMSRGRFIARQDAGGDISLPGRLRQQVEILEARPDAVMVSCATRFVGPDDEILFESALTDAELATGLSTLAIPGVAGPSSHGGTMFDRKAYEQVGGYRAAYVVAQDLDLWLRLFEVGACVTTPDILYQLRHSLGCISSRLRDEQSAFAAAAVECARNRRQGLPEPSFPMRGRSWAMVDQAASPDESSNLHYFLGACLRAHDPVRARSHFWRAVRAKPTHLKALARLLGSYF